MVKLQNVIDTRTGKFHRMAVIKDSYARYFVPADPETKEPISENKSEQEE